MRRTTRRHWPHPRIAKTRSPVQIRKIERQCQVFSELQRYSRVRPALKQALVRGPALPRAPPSLVPSGLSSFSVRPLEWRHTRRAQDRAPAPRASPVPDPCRPEGSEGCPRKKCSPAAGPDSTPLQASRLPPAISPALGGFSPRWNCCPTNVINRNAMNSRPRWLTLSACFS